MFAVHVLKILIPAFVVHHLACCVNGMEVIPERCGLTYTNPKYVTNVQLSVRRYSRGGPYVLNLQGLTQQTWGNNVTVHFIFYEYLHNEYKRSFVEMTNKLCVLIYKDPFLSPVFKKQNLVCPLPAGFWNLPNMTLISVQAVDNMPYKWPFEKGKIEAIVRTSDNEVMVQGYGIATFKQSNRSNKKT